MKGQEGLTGPSLCFSICHVAFMSSSHPLRTFRGNQTRNLNPHLEYNEQHTHIRLIRTLPPETPGDSEENVTVEGEVGGAYIRRVFLFGRETPEELGMDVSHLLRAESKRHGDILQWDFQDTFFNLTLKDVLFWSWFSHRCTQPLFVFKGDDDVFVNTPKLITFLKHQLKQHQTRCTMDEFMVGDVIGSATPNRVKRSNYFIPEGFYRGRYPVYAGGGGVVYSGGLAQRLHNIFKTIHLFPIDDVYVGMCMIRLNAHPVHHPAFLTFDFTEKEEAEPCSYHSILLVHKRSPREVVELWADIRSTREQCQDVPLRADKRKTLKTTPPPSA
ncbi:PREDICTED: N-acetyllactosaminide beta-1,3-N-acetylglucosaminyltransferase 2-like [Cyprinodon variegatus]|uniref:N-acetyllactosaminide beta-1,3-N-acetylglucosaminyltransferase 2-like n=1 Tax=Cyprinodon variegatus TaxID=28743 RepID=UPI0007424F9E|nr:PREDICTED: N-acetyllactosaminide beta-1,3-N-acetylglucosaminyltransferase 2-like [Cyprinodon variegatus]